MQITGQNLQAVQLAVELAMDEIHNQIATCPNVFEYADEIEALEVKQTYYKRLKLRIDAAVRREQEKIIGDLKGIANLSKPLA